MNTILDAIGDTPLVRLDRLTVGLEGRLFVKLDHLNPGGSKKDRAALGVIRAMRAEGSLRDGQTVVALTSGNMGTGLAIVCRALSHPFVAVMSRGNSAERAQMIVGLGAELVLVDQVDGVPGNVTTRDLEAVTARAAEEAKRRGAMELDQFEARGAITAHDEGTGTEILTQAGEPVHGFADFVGSGGTLAGVGRALRRADPSARLYAVEPKGGAVLGGHGRTGVRHPIEGGGYCRTDLPLLKGIRLDGSIEVAPDEALETAHRLAAEEGLFVGPSAGANVAACLKLLKGSERGSTLACVLCDSGMKYLSKGSSPTLTR